MNIKLRALILFISALVSLNLKSIKVERLTCELSDQPMEVENQNPRFGWMLSSNINGDYQTAYEIVVSKLSNPSLELQNVWSTGKVVSNKSQFILYKGQPLEKDTRYYWKVRVWNKDGKASSWSSVSTWSVAADPTTWNAKWIGAILRKDSKLPQGNTYATWGMSKSVSALWDNIPPITTQSLILRKSFVLEQKGVYAIVRICGLGNYELYVNGRIVDSSVLKPLWSDYEKTIYYNSYNITSLLQQGENVIAVELGNGMYNETGVRYSKFKRSSGPPTLLLSADIQLTNGFKQRIVSDESWKYDSSPITFNSIYGGEDYNANFEQKGWNTTNFNDDSWHPVVVQKAPQGKLTAQQAPAIHVADIYAVKNTTEVKANTYIFDMGQNLSGFPTIKIKGKKGDRIRITVGEVLNKTKTGLNQKGTGTPYYLDYTLNGNGVEEWTPKFTYYGYQYILIDNIDYKTQKKNSHKPVLLDLKSNFIHSSLGNDGSFECSNSLFNRVHFIIDKSVRSNMQAVFTDCPHREKLGWLEETHLNGPGLLFNYDLRQLYPKIMQDIADAQTPEGLIPDIAPEYVNFGNNGFRDSPEWGVAGVLIPWMYYEWYGDVSLLRKYYSVMRKYVDYLSSKADHGILNYGLGDWYDFGANPAGLSQNTPLSITATGHYYYAVETLAKAAAILHNKYDETIYAEMAQNIATSYNTKLFNKVTAQYGNGSQCSNALPLFLGIVPDKYKQKVLSNLLENIKEKGDRLSTGDVGNRYLYQALAENGENEIMYKIQNHKEIPGYGFQVDYGVTTLTENWDPRKGNSRNHFMMGQIEEWFYKSLGGIQPDIEHPGFKHFYICPAKVGNLTYVNSSYHSIYGLIESNWKIENGKFKLSVQIPVNTTATVIFPVGNKKSLVLGSGKYQLAVKL